MTASMSSQDASAVRRTAPSSPDSGTSAGDAIFEPEDGRRSQRLLVGGSLTCNLGRIIDLSEGGAMVVCRQPLPPTPVPFVLQDGALKFTCEATVKRTRKVGESRHTCALAFGAIDAAERSMLKRFLAKVRFASSRDYREAA